MGTCLGVQPLLLPLKWLCPGGGAQRSLLQCLTERNLSIGCCANRATYDSGEKDAGLSLKGLTRGEMHKHVDDVLSLTDHRVTLGKAVLREAVGGEWRWVRVDSTRKGFPGEANSRGQGLALVGVSGNGKGNGLSTGIR